MTELLISSGHCVNCGIPLDSQCFDDSRIVRVPEVGREEVLATFRLPEQYCGVLEHVAQFTDLQAREPEEAETPGLAWTLFADGQPVAPFAGLTHIVNPWGVGTTRTVVRLNDGARLELVVKRTSQKTSATANRQVRRVGGRIVGRYWYNPIFGEPADARWGIQSQQRRLP